MKHPLLSSEISWLSFNQCILDEANDESNPLYERIKFLAIHSSNLDEFFRVKIKALLEKPSKEKSHLTEILEEVNRQQQQIGVVWKAGILPQLKRNNIFIYENQPIKPTHADEIAYYFKSIVLSYIQVVKIADYENVTYQLRNRQLYLLVKLREPSGNHYYSYINIPSDKLDRYKLLQPIDQNHYIISLDEIINHSLPFIFNGDVVVSSHAIKLNRDDNYTIDDETTGSLVSKVKQKVKQRVTGSPTRFLYDYRMDPESILVCKKIFGLGKDEMIEGGAYHNLFDLFKLPNPLKPQLLNPTLPAVKHIPFERSTSVFDAIERENQLIHFPYQSYHYVLQFFNQAAIDKRVTEIKITLYRISSQSLIANALISAAKNGKKITVFVEIKARFDESNNLYWANEMKKAGIKIMYSLPNLKVHAKIALVTLMDDDRTKKYYSYLSTGNFNESTASIYADHGFFTAEKKYTSDLKQVFRFLRSKKSKSLDTLLVAGINMKSNIIRLIDAEINNQKEGRSAGILLKLNGMDDVPIIQKLYEASQAGVQITLIVRGICRLIPNVMGLSEHINVFRIVDLFLEHARVYKFNNQGNELLYLSSADMMTRNLDHRIEVAFPIEDEKLKASINKIIQFQLDDNTKRRTITSQGLNTKPVNDTAQAKRAQLDIYNWISKTNR